MMRSKGNAHEMPLGEVKHEPASDGDATELQPRRTRYLLSLDGGGVRGLASLAVLDKLMRLIDPSQPPKPCQVFDMIGGTSTGGLIAVMLGRLEMSVDDAIKAYRALASRAFTRKSGWPLPFVFDWATLTFNPWYGYDSAGLEQVIKNLVAWKLEDENALLLQQDPRCKIFVCATSAVDYYTTRIFQNYINPDHTYLFPDIKIWEACRATSAAPGFFEPITVSHGNHYRDTFRDGATGCNNPVDEVYENSRKLWPGDTFCVVSVGTGRPARAEWGNNLSELIKVLITISTETERTAHNFEQTHSTVPYFRFNVENGVGEIGLHEHEKADQILANSHNFLERNKLKKELQECAEILKTGEKFEIHNKEIRQDDISPEFQFKLVASPRSAWNSIFKILTFLISIAIAVLWVSRSTQTKSSVILPALNSTWPVFAVIGRTGVGKSSFIESLGGQHVVTMELPAIGDSLKSCTDQISWYKTTVDRTSLYLMDTPGFDDEHLDDHLILKMIWNDFKNASSMKDRHVTGIILLHDITQQRYGGAMLKNMDALQDLLGHDDFHRLALITTRWTDKIDQKTYDTWVDREHELVTDYWKDLVEAGAEFMRYDGTLSRATVIIQQLILNRDKKHWSKPRSKRKIEKISEPINTPIPTTIPPMTRKRWFDGTGSKMLLCFAVFCFISWILGFFKVREGSTLQALLGLCIIMDVLVFIVLVIKLLFW